jgi:hypothetical protein
MFLKYSRKVTSVVFGHAVMTLEEGQFVERDGGTDDDRTTDANVLIYPPGLRSLHRRAVPPVRMPAEGTGQ